MHRPKVSELTSDRDLIVSAFFFAKVSIYIYFMVFTNAINGCENISITKKNSNYQENTIIFCYSILIGTSKEKRNGS